MRSKKKDWNDVANGTYISMRAVQTLMKAGINFKFLRETKLYDDVTAIYQKRIYCYKQRKGFNLKTSELVENYDPFPRKK